jgi:ABC-type glycerol-3-phosphate transport system substrate-binding protein
MKNREKTTQTVANTVSRRRFVRTAGATAALAASAPYVFPRRVFAAKPTEIVHWSWLAASDGEIWAQMIDAYNEAHKDKGVQIRMELVPYEQYVTKVLASVATGRAPDFGWGTAGLGAQLARDGVTVPLDDPIKQSGLDLSDFTENSIKASRYPAYGNEMYMVPMDLMSLQPEINLDHVAEAGLDPSNPPQDGKTLLEWASAMSRREGDKVTRSGIMMTGSGVQPTVTWGIVAEQMGFQRASDDLKQAAVNADAGKEAMQWVLDLFDKHRVSTRDVTDRYKAFGTGQGSIFWTGPWTLSGYVQQGLNFQTSLFPKIGKKLLTYFEMGGLELYKQTDKGRYEATTQAVKWLSDNSFLWTTVGRGASPRKSILNRPDYKTAGHPWKVRGAFIEGMEFATAGEIPVVAGPDFTIYAGGNFLAKTLEGVWAGKKSIDTAMDQIQAQWQKGLDQG